MDDFDLLGDFPLGFEEVLDAGDITEADLNFAEISALDQAATGGQHWGVGLTSLKQATQHLQGLEEGAQGLIGTMDLHVALRQALQDVAELPSPFRG